MYICYACMYMYIHMYCIAIETLAVMVHEYMQLRHYKSTHNFIPTITRTCTCVSHRCTCTCSSAYGGRDNHLNR